MAEGFTFDFERRARIGLAEAVLCEHKTPEQISTALGLARERGMLLLFTRLKPETFDTLARRDRAALDYDRLSRTAIFGAVEPLRGEPKVALLSGGTSDLPVMRESARTLGFYGAPAAEFIDLGVAGLWRILRHEEELKRFPVVIVFAGMEGALFSVLGGLVPGLVIAVPVSVGYGIARSGETALHAALASCAPGIVAVNIDNGYGAACAALRALGFPAAHVGARSAKPGG